MMIRASRGEDVATIRAIYADNVLTGTGTFELVPPDDAEMAKRRAAVLALDLPYLVAEVAGQVMAYAYAGPFRPRPGYRFTVEDSVYVAAGAQGRGLGKALLKTLITDCEARGLRRMLAVIGDRENLASIAMHRACGFIGESVLPGAGWKFGRWLDLVIMHRPLGAGDTSAPDVAGLAL